MHQLSVGLGPTLPLFTNFAFAPAERIQLLLQTQDEVIHNLRKESDLQQRSIIAHAHLPYKDAQDCYQRLVEREGPKSLWRGYLVQITILALQGGIERWISQSRLMQGLGNVLNRSRDSRGTLPWIIGLSISATLVQSISLIALFPLTTLHARLSTDVIRKYKKSSPKPKKSRRLSTRQHRAAEDPDAVSQEQDIPLDTLSSSFTEFLDLEESGPTDMERLPGDVQAQTSDSESSFVAPENDGDIKVTDNENRFEFGYRYRGIQDAYDDILAKDGYKGFYQGMSSVVLGSFISCVGHMTVFSAMTPILIRSGFNSWAGLGSFICILGGTSSVYLVAYPFSTVAYRRMISGDRYTSSYDAARQIVENQGVRVLYGGFEVAMIRQIAIATVSRLFV
ncbi:hypothetical protein BGZ94_005085 [Podila epigama]|nr:hypothetical protein BGZ94_005085 [Podila epigama]